MGHFDETGNLVWEETAVDKEIHLALLRMGWLFPTTREEVAIVNASLRGRDNELPESLKEPPFHPLPE
jgi:hypothetical protein